MDASVAQSAPGGKAAVGGLQVSGSAAEGTFEKNIGVNFAKLFMIAFGCDRLLRGEEEFEGAARSGRQRQGRGHPTAEGGAMSGRTKQINAGQFERALAQVRGFFRQRPTMTNADFRALTKLRSDQAVSFFNVAIERGAVERRGHSGTTHYVWCDDAARE
jgi:hypothetical protein